MVASWITFLSKDVSLNDGKMIFTYNEENFSLIQWKKNNAS